MFETSVIWNIQLKLYVSLYIGHNLFSFNAIKHCSYLWNNGSSYVRPMHPPSPPNVSKRILRTLFSYLEN